MRYLAIVLLIVSLSVGALAAATAYHVPLSYANEWFVDRRGEDLQIKADAGVVILKDRSILDYQQQQHRLAEQSLVVAGLQPQTASGQQIVTGLLNLSSYKRSLRDRALSLSRVNTEAILEASFDRETGLVLRKNGAAIPLALKGDMLTPDLLKALKKQAESDDPRIKQKFVIVQEFSFERWPGKLIFLAAVLGLLAGSLMLRSVSKKEIAAAGERHEAEGPETALREIQSTLRGLRQEVSRSSESAEAQLLHIRGRLSELQRTHMDAFIEARPFLIARLGLGGFAELMDRYAACERQINRAWSAAADGIYEECVECLHTASDLIDETIPKLETK